MKTYRYTLEPYKGSNSRYTCPQCGAKNVFVRYIDTQTGKHIADDTGRCNREQKCGYHKKPTKLSPSAGGVDRHNKNNHWLSGRGFLKQHTPPSLSPSKERHASASSKPNTQLQIPNSIYQSSLFNYQNNQLVLYLHDTLPYKDLERVVDRYHIGTQGTSTVFWQIDTNGQIRGGKVMAYDKHTGKRRKDIPNAIQWMHTIHKLDNYQLHQCLFGEHLLRNNTQEVGIVESEKTALIAAALMPQTVWLATGGINNLTAERCKVLRDRKVTLYPDAGAYDKWLAVSRHIPHCSISPLLEQGFTPGSDIADYLLAA